MAGALQKDISRLFQQDRGQSLSKEARSKISDLEVPEAEQHDDVEGSLDELVIYEKLAEAPDLTTDYIFCVR